MVSQQGLVLLTAFALFMFLRGYAKGRAARAKREDEERLAMRTAQLKAAASARPERGNGDERVERTDGASSE
ncbi:MAG: hypothetical protein ACHREM_19795 [Polyangiales bacterium]